MASDMSISSTSEMFLVRSSLRRCHCDVRSWTVCMREPTSPRMLKMELSELWMFAISTPLIAPTWPPERLLFNDSSRLYISDIIGSPGTLDWRVSPGPVSTWIGLVSPLKTRVLPLSVYGLVEVFCPAERELPYGPLVLAR